MYLEMSVNRPAKVKRTSHPDQALKKNMQGRSSGLIRARGDISLMASEPWRGFDQQWYHLAGKEKPDYDVSCNLAIIVRARR